MLALICLGHSHLVDLVGVGVDDVHGASNTRIEAVHCPQDFQWPLGIRNWSTDERLLYRPHRSFGITRPKVPGGGYHVLVFLDFAFLDLVQ